MTCVVMYVVTFLFFFKWKLLGSMQVEWHRWTEMVNVSAFALFVGDFPWVLLKGFWLCNQSSKDMIMTMWLHLWPIKTCEKLSSQIGLSAGSCSNSLFPSPIKMAATALSFVAEPTKDLILHNISLIMCNRATGSYTDPHDYRQWRLSVTTTSQKNEHLSKL